MMKGTILAMMIATATATGTGNLIATETAQMRVMTGNYYDYMVIETVDGNEWLLDDSASPDNKYMKYDENINEYVSVFEDGELVQVVFDTMRTETVIDDVILTVRSID